MSKLLTLTIAFYDAAWDFSTHLCLLPDYLTNEPDPLFNPETLIQKYKEDIYPFLDLEGKDIGQENFAIYDQLDTTIRTEVFPALEVLTETWNEMRANTPSMTESSRLVFAGQCIYIIDILEMSIIAQAAELRSDLRRQPA